MRYWWELYKKEFISLSFTLLVTVLITMAWQFFLLYKADIWPQELVFGLSFIPLNFFPLIMLWMGYQSFRQEWKDDTIYFMLSLPRPGWQMTLAKLTAGMSIYTIMSSFTVLLIYFSNRDKFIKTILEDIPEYLSTDWIKIIVLKLLLSYLLFGFTLYILSQFSQLISQFYDRFRGLISIVVYILSSYLIFRGGSFLAPLLGWVPDFPVQVVNESFGKINNYIIYIGSGPIIGTLLMIVILFLTGSWLLEKHLEV